MIALMGLMIAFIQHMIALMGLMIAFIQHMTALMGLMIAFIQHMIALMGLMIAFIQHMIAPMGLTAPPALFASPPLEPSAHRMCHPRVRLARADDGASRQVDLPRLGEFDEQPG
jgi:hypothetical protein